MGDRAAGEGEIQLGPVKSPVQWQAWRGVRSGRGQTRRMDKTLKRVTAPLETQGFSAPFDSYSLFRRDSTNLYTAVANSKLSTLTETRDAQTRAHVSPEPHQHVQVQGPWESEHWGAVPKGATDEHQLRDRDDCLLKALLVWW